MYLPNKRPENMERITTLELANKFIDEQVEKIEMAIKDAKSKNNEQKEYKNKDLNYIKILNTIN